MNPYTRELEDAFRGKHVTVTADGRHYDGYARVFNFNDREVILYGATCDDEQIGTVAITNYDRIQRSNSPPMEAVPPSHLRGSPYASRTYDDHDMNTYVRKLRQRDGLYTFPMARPVADEKADSVEYELIGGHKRTEAAQRAGFETIPIRIIECSDWEALRMFVDEHIPMNKGEKDSGSDPNRGWYSKDEIDSALERMQSRWSEDELRSIPAVEYWLTYQPDEEADEPDGGNGEDEHGSTGENGSAEPSASDEQPPTTDEPPPDVADAPESDSDSRTTGMSLAGWPSVDLGRLSRRIQQSALEAYSIAGMISLGAVILAATESVGLWGRLLGPPWLGMFIVVGLTVGIPAAALVYEGGMGWPERIALVPFVAYAIWLSLVLLGTSYGIELSRTAGPVETLRATIFTWGMLFVFGVLPRYALRSIWRERGWISRPMQQN